MSTAPLERLDVVSTVEDLTDFAVPCDNKPRHRTETPDAHWITWWLPCCPSTPPVLLVCTPCLDNVMAHLHDVVTCLGCDRSARLCQRLLRWEPIDRRPSAPH